jgi:thiol-disulfide isomerase/thioredoxin
MPRFFTAVMVVLALALPACSGAPTTSSGSNQVNGLGLMGESLEGQRCDLDRVLASGKWVTLVFWQDWCSSCLVEAPHVQAASQIYRNQIAFYGVVSGADQTEGDFGLRTKVRELGLTYPQVRDRNGSWSARYHVTSTPTVLVFSPDGALQYRGDHLPGDWNQLLAQ